MRYEKILVEDSEKYFDLFDPDLYNPREWAKMAKAAGDCVAQRLFVLDNEDFFLIHTFPP